LAVVEVDLEAALLGVAAALHQLARAIEVNKVKIKDEEP
jgi:hypothetical protein